MTTFHYFAYGSNLLPHRLQRRCESARLVGVAEVRDYSLDFSKRSNDRSGKATIFKQNNAKVIGAIFEIKKTEQSTLDGHESLGSGYERDDNFEVMLTQAQQAVQCSTYIAPHEHRDYCLDPYDWYLGLVIAGARLHAFPEKSITRLKNQTFTPDPRLARQSRHEAIGILSEAGYPLKNILNDK